MQPMIQHVVSAAELSSIQSLAKSFESQAVFRKYPFS